MGSAAFAYRYAADIAELRPRQAAAARVTERPRAVRSAKLPLRLRIGLIVGGALLGWAVPIACAATLL